MSDYGKILFELQQIKAKISTLDMESKIVDGFISRKTAMAFFDLSKSAMISLEKTGKLEVSSIGQRKFYTLESIQRLLSSHIMNK